MASCENPIGKVTAARQKKITEKMSSTYVKIFVCWMRGSMYFIPATKPTHFAYGVTVLSQSVAISRTIVVVTQIHPQKTQTRVICKE